MAKLKMKRMYTVLRSLLKRERYGLKWSNERIFDGVTWPELDLLNSTVRHVMARHLCSADRPKSTSQVGSVDMDELEAEMAAYERWTFLPEFLAGGYEPDFLDALAALPDEHKQRLYGVAALILARELRTHILLPTDVDPQVFPSLLLTRDLVWREMLQAFMALAKVDPLESTLIIKAVTVLLQERPDSTQPTATDVFDGMDSARVSQVAGMVQEARRYEPARTAELVEAALTVIERGCEHIICDGQRAAQKGEGQS